MKSTVHETVGRATPDTLSADDVRRMFAALVPRYDLLNAVLSCGLAAGWRRAVARQFTPGAVLQVADLCAGTGDLTAAIARRLGDGAVVVGVDFCAPMIVRAQQKFSRRRGVRFVVGDATCLPFGDEMFDAATVAFGLRNVADPQRALGEMVRIVRPGGRIIIMEFCRPRHRAWRTLFELYFQHVLPLVGRVVSGHGFAYSYLPASVRRFTAPEELAAALERAGTAAAAVERLAGGVVAIVSATKQRRR